MGRRAAFSFTLGNQDDADDNQQQSEYIHSAERLIERHHGYEADESEAGSREHGVRDG